MRKGQVLFYTSLLGTGLCPVSIPKEQRLSLFTNVQLATNWPELDETLFKRVLSEQICADG